MDNKLESVVKQLKDGLNKLQAKSAELNKEAEKFKPVAQKKIEGGEAVLNDFGMVTIAFTNKDNAKKFFDRL